MSSKEGIMDAAQVLPQNQHGWLQETPKYVKDRIYAFLIYVLLNPFDTFILSLPPLAAICEGLLTAMFRGGSLHSEAGNGTCSKSSTTLSAINVISCGVCCHGCHINQGVISAVHTRQTDSQTRQTRQTRQTSQTSQTSQSVSQPASQPGRQAGSQSDSAWISFQQFVLSCSLQACFFTFLKAYFYCCLWNWQSDHHEHSWRNPHM